MKTDVLLPSKSDNIELIKGLSSLGEDCGFIGAKDETVFKFVDPLFMDNDFYSSDSSIHSFVVGVYQQKENTICSPNEVFSEIAAIAGGIDEICLPSEKYVKRIVMDNEGVLYFYWHGTFFLYKNKKGHPIIAQVNYGEKDGLEITTYRLEDFNAPLNGLDRQLYVVFSHFI